MVFTQIVHGKKCSLGHEETFFSWKFSLKIIQQKDTVNIRGCYNENQGCYNENQHDSVPDLRYEATMEQQQTVVVVEPGESVFEVVQCVSRFSRCFR